MSCEKVAGSIGTLDIISRNQGWMTVTPQTMDKKHPINMPEHFWDKTAK